LDLNILDCTFEHPDQRCKFDTLTTIQNIKWNTYTGSSTSIKIADHTIKTLGGKFFGIDIGTGGGKPVVGETRVASEQFNATKGTCVTFWYQIRGIKQEEMLTLFIRRDIDHKDNYRPDWIVTGEQGPFWYSHRINVVSDKKWQIVFGAVLKGSVSGLIAIDDIRVEFNKPCPQPRRCDFEREDTCLWESIGPTKNEISRDQRLGWSKKPIGMNVINNILQNTELSWTVHSPWHGAVYKPMSDHTIGKN